MDVDITVIGAGVVGLAVAARLAPACKNLFVVERNPSFGQETSSRNSEVIHAGLYYPPGSLKARLCVRGRHLLYELVEKAGIAHRRCGKLLVATEPAEEKRLEQIAARGAENGVEDLQQLSSAQVRRLEPRIRATAGLLSPSTGIIDSHRLMRHLLAAARRHGAQVVYNATVVAVDPREQGGFAIHVTFPDGTTERFTTARVINCAGLNADAIAASAGIDIDAAGYRQHFWKGEYFSCDLPAGTLRHLIYPVPLPQTVGLGIHATVDLTGRIRFGPNAIYLPDGRPDYTVDPGHRNDFYTAAVRYLPELLPDQLQPEMAGVRPKLQRPGDAVRDFIVAEEKDRGLAGMVNCIGIESPGLTSCLAIAEHVAALLNHKG